MNALTAYACNVLLGASGIPDWVQLLPVGPTVSGFDGRSWTLPDPKAVVNAFLARNHPIPIDWEHASEHRAPVGLDAPAAGWIDTMETRDGAIWGHVEWTDVAKQQIETKQYRYLSPVFTYSKGDKVITQIISAGLTNQPNLQMSALNQEEPPMNLPAALALALNLPTTADEAEAVRVVSGLKTELETAKNAMNTPALEKFVPRPDYDAVLARASNAESKLKEWTAAQANQAIETALNTALAAGQICPATVEFYRAGCQQDGGLERFQTFLKTAPSVLGEPSKLSDKKPVNGSDPAAQFAANAELKAEFGDVETYLAYQSAADRGIATILGSKAI